MQKYRLKLENGNEGWIIFGFDRRQRTGTAVLPRIPDKIQELPHNLKPLAPYRLASALINVQLIIVLLGRAGIIRIFVAAL